MTKTNQKKILIMGHRNPDTDSIVSAIAYSELKKHQGIENCYPVRVGKINPQTDYILKRFKIAKPEFISDLIPKVSNYMSTSPVTVDEGTPLWRALELLNQDNHKMLPVVDSENQFLSVLHYNAFAENMLKKIDPHRQSIIPTSIAHLLQTLHGQEVLSFNTDEIFRARILVAASELDTLHEFIKAVPRENTVVIAGNRNDVHQAVIHEGVRCLIVTGGKTVTKEIKDIARQKETSIIISPFDTATSSLISFYSTPVRYMCDDEQVPLREDDYIKNIREKITSTASRSLPVVDDNNRIIGIISQGDLMKEPNIEVILVDHNELSQAAEGIENYKILEIIDHHRLGNPPTAYPITFINKPVGSTSTIIASLFTDNKIPLKKDIASILLAGILSDTLIMRSATTTETDQQMAQYLSEITDLEISEFGNEIMHAASQVGKKPVDEILAMDLKKYPHGDMTFSVSQVEVTTLTELMERREDILKALSQLHNSSGLLFSALLVTDITELNSIFFISGSPDVIKEISYPKLYENVFNMKGILSRKKQLIPYLTDVIAKAE